MLQNFANSGVFQVANSSKLLAGCAIITRGNGPSQVTHLG
jgi:hypothetical protein